MDQQRCVPDVAAPTPRWSPRPAPRVPARVLTPFAVAAAAGTLLAGCTSPDAPVPGSRTAAVIPRTTGSSQLVLADEGIGGLRLGMTWKDAQATGLLGALRKDLTPDDDPHACRAHAGKRGVDLVYLSGDRVVIIAVTGRIRTAGGIGVGDTYEALHERYPDATPGGPGRLSAPAPGAPLAASYRFGTDAGDAVYPDSKITEIALQADDQTCYE